MNIRPILSDELIDLLGLCAEHAYFEQHPFSSLGKAELLLEALRSEPKHLWIWVAADKAKLVGYASASREFSTWQASHYLHLDCLFVRDAWRGHNIGEQLFMTVKAHAQQLGFNQMQWQTPQWNSLAAQFYTRLGGDESPKRRFILSL